MMNRRAATRISLLFAAMLLGWLFLQEEITSWTLGGSVLILLGVTGVFREKYGKKKVER